MTSPSFEVAESAGLVEVCAEINVTNLLPGELQTDVTVVLDSRDGTALGKNKIHGLHVCASHAQNSLHSTFFFVENSDYMPMVIYSLVFEVMNPGSVKCGNITIIADTVVEPSESFRVELASLPSNTLATIVNSMATVTILPNENDGKFNHTR